jgi:hypothetical protein
MKLDDAILEELEHGSGTVKGISERLSDRVYNALERLVKADKVKKEGYQGKGNEKIYNLSKATPLITRRL